MKKMKIEVPAPCNYDTQLAQVDKENCVTIKAYDGGRKQSKEKNLDEK